MKKCIALLTRGYNDRTKYGSLIQRNIHIDNNLVDKTIDILIFHEGNINQEDQVYIKNNTPELNIIFIDISNIAFNSDKQSIPFEEAHEFSLSYRHMCSFWFIHFFDVVKEYDKLLRIDEDCLIHSNIDKIFLTLDDYVFTCGIKSGDEEFVTKGLNEFSLNFLNNHKDEYYFKQKDTKIPNGPYTNLFGLNLENTQNNTIFQLYKKEIDDSNMIYKRRWGDLPLWGEVIYYIFGEDTLKVDNTIKYYHGSHNFNVN